MLLDVKNKLLYYNNNIYKLTELQIKFLLLLSDNNQHTYKELQEYMNTGYFGVTSLVNRIWKKAGVYIKNISGIGYILKKDLFITY